MNTSAQALVFAVASVAAAAAIGTVLADYAAQPKTEIVHLDRVVVVGHRTLATAQIEQLPRVIVVGHRSTQLAAAKTSSKTV